MATAGCLRCHRRGDTRLFTLDGCRDVCYVCSRCYEDKKLTDNDILIAVSSACGGCLPGMARELARRSCVYCRKFGRPSATCNCPDGHYVCRDCIGAKGAKAFLADLHKKKAPVTVTIAEIKAASTPALSEVGHKPRPIIPKKSKDIPPPVQSALSVHLASRGLPADCVPLVP